VENNIIMNRRKIGWEDVDWMHLAQHRDERRALVITIMNLLVPYKAGNFLTRYVTIRFTRRTLLHGVRQSVNNNNVGSNMQA
jgi:hypothetical protein